MNDQSEQNRTDGENDHGPGEESLPEVEQIAEVEDEVLRPEEIAERPPNKSKMPPSRIAFLVFAVVAALAIVLELRARWSYTGTVESLNQAFEKAEMGFYREDLEKLVRGSPSRDYNEQTRTETFTWRGIRAHRLEVQYGKMNFVERYGTP